jgi:hypothetical protein
LATQASVTVILEHRLPLQIDYFFYFRLATTFFNLKSQRYGTQLLSHGKKHFFRRMADRRGGRNTVVLAASAEAVRVSGQARAYRGPWWRAGGERGGYFEDGPVGRPPTNGGVHPGRPATNGAFGRPATNGPLGAAV